MDVGDAIVHRPVNDILADLTDARLARENADKALEEILTQLKLRNKRS